MSASSGINNDDTENVDNSEPKHENVNDTLNMDASSNTSNSIDRNDRAIDRTLDRSMTASPRASKAFPTRKRRNALTQVDLLVSMQHLYQQGLISTPGEGGCGG